jgi:hypothetical protein
MIWRFGAQIYEKIIELEDWKIVKFQDFLRQHPFAARSYRGPAA